MDNDHYKDVWIYQRDYNIKAHKSLIGVKCRLYDVGTENPGYSFTCDTPKSLNSKELNGRGACPKVPKPPRGAGCLKS